MTLSQKAFSLLQYPLPQHALSRLTGKFAQCDNPWVKDTLIKAFIKRFKVDMSQALEPDPTAYATFNDFFTRALKADARPLGEGLLSPADGTLSQFGRLTTAGKLVQAKGHTFSVQTLLGGDKAGHDWANMLGMLGLLDYDQIVGGFFYVLALLTFVALLALPRYMLKITSRN